MRHLISCHRQAYRAIRFGYADAIIAEEARLLLTVLQLQDLRTAPLFLPGTSPMKVRFLSDARRDGFVIGEGAGILILEEYEHAKTAEQRY